MAKAAPKKKTAPKKAAKKASTAPKPITKTQLLVNLSETTGINKKEVIALLDALSDEIEKSLAAKGPGAFTLPGLLKIVKKEVPAKPARPVRNPQTGETIMAKPKPASTTVKVRPLTKLKEMVAK